MFEKAARLKLRFEHKGLCSAEDLWDLPLRELDTIFKGLNAQIRTEKEESLLEKKSQEDEIMEIKVAIVRHVVEVRLQEQKAREDAAAKADRKQRLLGIIADKQDEELRGMSVEELTKIVDEM
jgi:hypothetical protein